MGLIDFVKEAGEKLFGRGKRAGGDVRGEGRPGNAAKTKAANDAAGDAILGVHQVAEPQCDRPDRDVRRRDRRP